jgi:hypothetical protein
LFKSAGDARLNSAYGNFKNLGDLRIGVILQIKEGDRRLVDGVDLCQSGQHLRGIYDVGEVG